MPDTMMLIVHISPFNCNNEKQKHDYMSTLLLKVDLLFTAPHKTNLQLFTDSKSLWSF